MNAERLQIYLNDHLALIRGELELIARCRKNNSQGPLGVLLIRLQTEVEAHEQALNGILEKLGAEADPIKQGVAWLAEKLGRLKLNDSLLEYSDLSRLVEVEALAVAAWERVALWEHLGAVLSREIRFELHDFAKLKAEADAHVAALVEQRLEAARVALSG